MSFPENGPKKPTELTAVSDKTRGTVGPKMAFFWHNEPRKSAELTAVSEKARGAVGSKMAFFGKMSQPNRRN